MQAHTQAGQSLSNAGGDDEMMIVEDENGDSEGELVIDDEDEV